MHAYSHMHNFKYIYTSLHLEQHEFKSVGATPTQPHRGSSVLSLPVCDSRLWLWGAWLPSSSVDPLTMWSATLPHTWGSSSLCAGPYPHTGSPFASQHRCLPYTGRTELLNRKHTSWSVSFLFLYFLNSFLKWNCYWYRITCSHKKYREIPIHFAQFPPMVIFCKTIVWVC